MEIRFLFSILQHMISRGKQSKIFINNRVGTIFLFHGNRFGAILYFIIMKVCAVEGCEKKYYAKSYCVKHYQKLKKYGDPLYTKIHGFSNSLTYKSWESIKNRCLNKNTPYYKYYGGRGITVCDEWKNSFLAFYNDMGPRPSKEYSIDRIDNDKGYSKENCRWATRSEQSFNRRLQSNNTSGCKGVKYDKRRGSWSAQIQYNKKRKYLGTFKTKEQAVESRKQAEKKYGK